MARDIFHKAARDGYVELLHETTRRDCDRPDEDGRSPTLWAACHGNLEALRVLTSRGGNPDRCDHLGSTALHLAASSGHLNCVSFLVAFGANIWALDNDFHTPLDIAALHDRSNIVKFLDSVAAKQVSMNSKVVNKLKEKAVAQAEKRVKMYEKQQAKAEKQAIEEDKEIRRESTQMEAPPKPPRKFSTLRVSKIINGKRSTQKNDATEPLPYSAHFTGSAKRKTIARKLRTRSYKGDRFEQPSADDFKVGNLGADGTRTVKSLSGLRRDSHVMYVRGTSIDSESSANQKCEYSDRRSRLQRATSEPDIVLSSDSGIDTDSDPLAGAGIFERPGFGSVSFINRNMTLMSLRGASEAKYESKSVGGECQACGSLPKKKKEKAFRTNVPDADSIGSVGTLAHRMTALPWDDDESVLLDDDEIVQSSSLELFLFANGLQEFLPLFSREKVDLDTISLLGDEDLMKLGLSLGPRRKLLKAISHRQKVLEESGPMFDTML